MAMCRKTSRPKKRLSIRLGRPRRRDADPSRPGYRGVRWFSWLTGAPIIAFVYASGMGGYWRPKAPIEEGLGGDEQSAQDLPQGVHGGTAFHRGPITTPGSRSARQGTPRLQPQPQQDNPDGAEAQPPNDDLDEDGVAESIAAGGRIVDGAPELNSVEEV
jgi:hypothetical protein